MKKFLLRALAVVPILLLVTSLASADSAMQLIVNGGAPLAPTSTTGCGVVDTCINNYLIVGTGLTVSVDTGSGGGPPSTITLTTANPQAVGTLPAGTKLEIDYVVNGYTGIGTNFAHSFGGTLFGHDTATNNISFNAANTLAFSGTLVDSLTVGSGMPFLAASANSTGAFGFTPAPYSLIDQIIINVTDTLTIGQSLQETSAFTVSNVPEPASLMLLGGGFLGLANILRRKLAK